MKIEYEKQQMKISADLINDFYKQKGFCEMKVLEA